VNEPFRAPVPYVPLPARIGVLLSGRGSNFEALAEACRLGEMPARIVVVASDRPGAEGLRKAERRSIPAHGLDPAALGSKAALEARLLELLSESSVDIICLAGYMRILSPEFVSRYRLRILNIHPSLLPAFPGLDPQAQALLYGVRVSGATVHFVEPGVDKGPIVDQEPVLVGPGDSVEALSDRILAVEHRLYPAALRTILEGGWTLSGRAVLRKNPTFEGLSRSRPSPMLT
jgi:phosphoribosylglycinamide formyltransferase 1